MGYCPSGRLFEAAACGTAMLSDWWEGLDAFFTPGRRDSDRATTRPTPSRRSISRTASGGRSDARRARAALDCHTAAIRAGELERCIGAASQHQCFRGVTMWGIVPAAGQGSRMQPLAFSKELLPVGSRVTAIASGRARSASISSSGWCSAAPTRSASSSRRASRTSSSTTAARCSGARVLQRAAAGSGLCDAIFRALPLIHDDEQVMVGLPDTIWFPEGALRALPDDRAVVPVVSGRAPELFDAVVLDGTIGSSKSRSRR